MTGANVGRFFRWRYSGHVIGLLVVLAWMMPHIVLGETSYILIHDYLDSIVAWSKVLTDQGVLFSPQATPVLPIMNGVPRSSFGSEFNLLSLFMLVLPAFKAMIATELVVRLTAFAGMFLVLRGYALAGHPYRDVITACVSTMFCTLPFWPGGGVSVAGVPLALWAFLEARQTLRVAHVAVMAYFAAFSGLVGIGIFLVTFLGLIWLADWIAGRKRLGPLVLVVLLALFYALFDYRLMASVVTSAVTESHRKEMVIDTMPFLDALEEARLNLINGQYHAWAMQGPFMLWICGMAIVFPPVARWFGLPMNAMMYRRLLIWSGATLLTALIYGLWQWSVVQQIWQGAGLPYVNLARFHWLQPALWSTMMAFSLALLLAYMSKHKRTAYAILIIITVLQVRVNWMEGDFRMEKRGAGVTFQEFYSLALFADIAKSIGKPKSEYRIGMLGVSPAIAQYNGFYSVDGYVANYPYEYKRKFRKIIAAELARDEALTHYFDDWGSRAYIFSSELAYCNQVCTKSRIPDYVIHRLDVDAFRALGGSFIFSATAIGNARTLGLVEFGVFERSDSPWRIHVYGLKPVK